MDHAGAREKGLRYAVRRGGVGALAVAARITGPLWRSGRRWVWSAGVRAHARRVGPCVYAYGPVYFLGTANVVLGDCGNLYDNVLFETEIDGSIVIGNNFTVNRGSLLSAHVRISIGDNLLMGEYVSVRDSDHVYRDASRPIREQGFDSRPIQIGSDVWIGHGAVILKGVTIGDGAVIGANSVVNREIPAMEVWAGAPARRIGRRTAVGSA